jgi:2-amino-4-hydroxy-6-hydroxymethyldihydropteridine diphosphokinase
MLREEFRSVEFSHVYETAPRDEVNQENFLNAVVKVESELATEEIYKKTCAIEEKLQKNPPYDKGPRTIDIDLLLHFSSSKPVNQSTNKLTLPHPRMHERRFVLEPLMELLGESETWNSFLQKTMDQECRQIEIKL